MNDESALVLIPDFTASESFTDANAAVDRLESLYFDATGFLSQHFSAAVTGAKPATRIRAFYPEIRLSVSSHIKTDSRLAFGHVASPGTYATSVTRPDLFRSYLIQQISLLMQNHNVAVQIGYSDTPIPVHFAVAGNPQVSVPQEGVLEFSLRDVFDVPDLATTNDDIVNGTRTYNADGSQPLAPFTAQRVDYSLARLSHYTATDATHFQNHVLFTNYQFYVDEFEAYARTSLADVELGLHQLCGDREPRDHHAGWGDLGIKQDAADADLSSETRRWERHYAGEYRRRTLQRQDRHRPYRRAAAACLADGRPLRGSAQQPVAGRFLSGPCVLCAKIMCWTTTCRCGCQSRRWPKFRLRLQEAVAEVTQLEGYELKRIMRTGTVATIDNRNWELRDKSGPVQRLSQSRAIALDMESATIAANGFRFRVPYGTLLCVSDKPLHGELKLPGMASEFYKTQGRVICKSASARWSGCAICRLSGFTAASCAVLKRQPSCDPRKCLILSQKGLP